MKLRVMQLLLETRDISKISRAMAALKTEEAAQHTPSQEEIDAVEKAMQSVEAGHVIPHDEARNQVKQRFPYLKH